MPKDPHLLIIAGDPSADRHGAALVDALRQAHPRLRISAMGGPHLKEKADLFCYPLAGIGGFGFWEPIFKLPQLWSAWRMFLRVLQQDRPDIVVPMDYFGFNIHVARRAHAHKIPVAYYISPQVWASRPGRVAALAAAVDKMLVIFPFESAIYQKAGVPVRFVGHPLTECLPPPAPEAALPTIGLLPGSRRATAARHLPLLIQTAELLRLHFPQARCLLFRPGEIGEDFYHPYLKGSPWIELIADPSYEARKSLWLAIGVSGTAALENMLLGIPMIIMYRLSRLTYWIAKALIRVPFIGIPNLLAGRLVVPELLQDEATPHHLAQAAGPLMESASKRDEMRRTLLSLRHVLQSGGSASAADEILDLLRTSSPAASGGGSIMTRLDPQQGHSGMTAR
jgi:lipid-A-disaccharide synthase